MAIGRSAECCNLPNLGTARLFYRASKHLRMVFNIDNINSHYYNMLSTRVHLYAAIGMSLYRYCHHHCILVTRMHSFQASVSSIDIGGTSATDHDCDHEHNHDNDSNHDHNHDHNHVHNHDRNPDNDHDNDNDGDGDDDNEQYCGYPAVKSTMLNSQSINREIRRFAPSRFYSFTV